MLYISDICIMDTMFIIKPFTWRIKEVLRVREYMYSKAIIRRASQVSIQNSGTTSIMESVVRAAVVQ